MKNKHPLRKIVKVEEQEELHGKQALLITLECGHSYIVLDASLDWYKKQIEQGKKTRCKDC